MKWELGQYSLKCTLHCKPSWGGGVTVPAKETFPSPADSAVALLPPVPLTIMGWQVSCEVAQMKNAA